MNDRPRPFELTMQASRVEPWGAWLFVVAISTVLVVAWLSWALTEPIRVHAHSEHLTVGSFEDTTRVDAEGTRMYVERQRTLAARFDAATLAKLHVGQDVTVFVREPGRVVAVPGVITTLDSDASGELAELRVLVEAASDPFTTGSLERARVELDHSTPIGQWFPELAKR